MFKRILLMLFFSTNALAAGFQLYEQSASGLGNAFAGTAATAEDASTGWYNPAGLSYIDHFQVSGVLDLINTNQDVKNLSGTTTTLFPGPAAPITGNNRADAGGWFVVPAFHIAYPFSDCLSFGLGVTSPYGLTTSYPSSTITRYLATFSNLTTINIGPSVAYQVMEGLSLGAGVDAQYADATLKNKVPSGGGARDAELKIEGDDWSFGWNIGALYCAPFGTRFGLHYRSRIHHKLEGDAVFRDLPAFLGVGGAVNGEGTAKLTIPDTVNFSVVHDFNDCWALLANVIYTHWDLVDVINVNYSGAIGNVLPTSELKLAFKNSYRYALAVNYSPNECWKFRMGLSYDESPVDNSSTRTYRLPDNDRIWLGFGVQYNIHHVVIVDAGYAHIFGRDTSIAQTNVTPNVTTTVLGEADVSGNVFGLQISWNVN